MRADNTAHIVAASRRRTEQTHHRAAAALRRLDTNGTPVTFEALAREAGVSRSWLYAQPDLRAEITRLRARHQPSIPVPRTPDRQRATTPSLLRRLEATTERVRSLENDNRRLRDALAEALGDARAGRILRQSPGCDTPGSRSDKTIEQC